MAGSSGKKGVNMEVAWHMTKKGDDKLSGELAGIYKELNSSELCLEAALSKPNRIYVGDEFCVSRMPSLKTLSKFIGFADKKDVSLTLLTPVLTNQGVEQLTPLFDLLSQWNHGCEVVVNDVGVLFFLKKQYPEFHLAMGRLFNKGFKDPRLEIKDIRISEKMVSLLNDCSFNQENIQVLAEGLGIQRFEQDLLPYADPVSVGITRLLKSIYLPFGYVTTGRVCFTTGLNGTAVKNFGLQSKCSSPCATHRMELKHTDLAFKLFQNGNAIFYLYTPAMIRSLLENAQQQGIRLIFQGGLL